MAGSQVRKLLVTRRIPSIVERIKSQFPEAQTLHPQEDGSKVMSRTDLLTSVEGCDGIFCLLTDRIDEEVLARAGSQLKIVSTMSVGYNHIDVEACSRHDVRVGYTPGVLDKTTAETAVALAFTVSRAIMPCINAAKNGDWKVWQPFQFCGTDISETTVGVVGLGRIGTEFAKMMKNGFGCRIIYSGPRPKREAEALLDAQYLPLEELLRTSDIVSVHTPLTEATRRLVNKDFLETMKRSAILINTSRGEVVDQEALYEALTTRKICGAGLDVTDPEPLPPSHKLFQLENCVILPHIGSATFRTRHKMADIAVQNLIAGLRGEHIPHCVNPY